MLAPFFELVSDRLTPLAAALAPLVSADDDAGDR